MKKAILLISIIALFFAGCKKDDIAEASKVRIETETIEKGWDYIKINVEYDYPVALEAVTLYLSEKEDMSDANVYECNVEGKKYSVELDSLKAGVAYYYCYEYDNGYEKERCDVGAFTKSMCCYYRHEYVDLGLPSGLKWATCNVGAATPEEYGDYFAWGEISTKANYNGSNCPTYGLSNSELQSQGYIDGEGNLTAQYDAATANWGGEWRMPTKAEQEELLNNCTWTWTTQNGVNGYNVEGLNGNSIFLPAAGERNWSLLNYAGSSGDYWSSSPNYFNFNLNAYYLSFDSDSQNMGNGNRHLGQSVRPVVE